MVNLLVEKTDQNPVVEVFTEGSVKLPHKKITSRHVAEVSEKILNYLQLKNVSISVIITDNVFIQDINNRFRDKNRPTDVISFAYRDELFPGEGSRIEELGDIYISIEKAEEQAPEYENSLEGEVKRLLVHGILHLSGYDHEGDEEEADKMYKLEEEIISNI